MTNTCVRIYADGIRDKQPTISERELIEQLRERIMFAKRHEREDQKRVYKLYK